MADGERWVPRVLTLGWAVVGLVVVEAAVELLRAGWVPVIDGAVITSMSLDSLGTDPPLVGVPTSLGLEGGEPLSHPGPLGLWLLAVPAKLLGTPGRGMVVGAALLSLVWVAALAVLVRRHRDPVLEAIVLVLTGGMVVSLGGTYLVDPFNPYLGILPLLVAMVATWGVLAGHHRHLWVLVVAGSLAAQTHLGYVVLVALLVLLAGTSLAIEARRTDDPARRRRVGRIAGVGALVGVVAWLGPILDLLVGSQNLVRLVTAQGEDRPSTGLGHGLDVLVEMTSLPPRWLADRATDADLSDPSAARTALSVLAIVAVVGLFAWAVRRRDRSLATLVVVAVAGVAAAALTSSRVVDPMTSRWFVVENAVLYRLFWWPVGVVFTTALVWGVVRALAVVAPLRRLRPAGLPAAVVLVLVLGWWTRDAGRSVPQALLEPFWEHEVANAEAIADLPGSPDVVVLRLQPEGSPPPKRPPGEAALGVWDLGPDRRYGYAANLVAQLRLRGIEVRFAEEADDGVVFLAPYRADHPAEGDEPVELLYLVGRAVPDEPPPGYELVSLAGPPPGGRVDPLDTTTAVYRRT